MRVSIVLICKVFKHQSINVLSNKESNSLPAFELVNDIDINTQISNYLKSTFNLMSNWLDIKLFSCKIIDGILHIFYSTWVPTSFLEKEIKYLNLSEFKDSDAVLNEIANSLRIKPY